ncbi:hypothetical protein [Ruixingdingia sedimenti]|uniref:Uncharacterized protein n=1 Tax=Ruixingdingia sedimenti TaxID=3073604 RepID=A0ABU1FF89_9RHOB|nr:hypothetical protein [Xinfangfangia sp. LG-4]MDR5655561.1 hypothetical protein [Xinfangfangia sp. LG-4]
MPTKINTEALERIRAKLNDLPPKPKDAYSGREAITELEAAIRHAQSLDYDIAEIATMLTENGSVAQIGC